MHLSASSGISAGVALGMLLCLLGKAGKSSLTLLIRFRPVVQRRIPVSWNMHGGSFSTHSPLGKLFGDFLPYPVDRVSLVQGKNLLPLLSDALHREFWRFFSSCFERWMFQKGRSVPSVFRLGFAPLERDSLEFQISEHIFRFRQRFHLLSFSWRKSFSDAL